MDRSEIISILEDWNYWSKPYQSKMKKPKKESFAH